MLRSVVLVRTDVPPKCRHLLGCYVVCGSCKNRHPTETSLLTTTTRRNIPEDSILHSHRCENLKSYMALTC
jgi:hypothetical protein